MDIFGLYQKTDEHSFHMHWNYVFTSVEKAEEFRDMMKYGEDFEVRPLIVDSEPHY